MAGHPAAVAVFGLAMLGPMAAMACVPGVYGSRDTTVAVLTQKAGIPAPGLHYLLLDGRYGATSSERSPVVCRDGRVSVTTEAGMSLSLEAVPLRRTLAEFPVADAVLAGELLEREGGRDRAQLRPLVVMVQGSEREPAIAGTRALMLAALDIVVFSYDKRGTGQSGGTYTQNFELLADDAAAAMVFAQGLKPEHAGRAGYWGQSQGGWIAPLAATRSHADFVAVGFGLVASPIEEDLDQMLLEAQGLRLGTRETAQIDRLSAATAVLMSSRFSAGFEGLEDLRRETAGAAWVQTINGEYSGAMLRMSDAELRRVGRALFDNLELIWDYDGRVALHKLDAPLLWTIAASDREAPPARTLAALRDLKAGGKPFDVFIFPDTDHGMYEFVEDGGGRRRRTRVTDGYFRLIADWIHGRPHDIYGRGRALEAE